MENRTGLEVRYRQYQFFDSSIDIQLTLLNWVSIVVLKIASLDIVMDRKADRLISSTCGNCCVPCSEFLTSPAAYLHSSSPEKQLDGLFSSAGNISSPPEF